jgi:hypothetical protein
MASRYDRSLPERIQSLSALPGDYHGAPPFSRMTLRVVDDDPVFTQLCGGYAR